MKIRCIILILSFLLFSCEKNVTDRFLDAHENVFIISGELSAGEHPVINLTRSITLLQPDSLWFLDNARVEIRGGQDSYLMKSAGYGNYTCEDCIMEAGKEYHFLCSGEGLPDASSTVRIPEIPVLAELTLTADEEYNFTLDLVMNDPAGCDDFYTLYSEGWLTEIVHHHKNDTDYIDTTTFFTRYRMAFPDSLVEFTGTPGRFSTVEEGYSRASTLHFSDKLFNGGSLHFSSVNAWGSFYNDSIPEVQVCLEHRDEHYFNFIRSIIHYDPNSDLPVIQPIQVYSNIEGGFGLLTTKNTIRRTIDMSRWFHDPDFPYRIK
jgi:hypothetical protein